MLSAQQKEFFPSHTLFSHFCQVEHSCEIGSTNKIQEGGTHLCVLKNPVIFFLYPLLSLPEDIPGTNKIQKGGTQHVHHICTMRQEIYYCKLSLAAFRTLSLTFLNSGQLIIILPSSYTAIPRMLIVDLSKSKQALTDFVSFNKNYVSPFVNSICFGLFIQLHYCYALTKLKICYLSTIGSPKIICHLIPMEYF